MLIYLFSHGVGMEEGLLGGIDSSSSSSEGSKEVSAEELVKVSENAKKAAQAGMQTRANQQSNNQLAQFLEFLFSDIKSDEIWEILVQLCTTTDSTGIGMMLSLPELIAFVAPFYPTQMEQYGIYHVLPQLPHIPHMSREGYLDYLHTLNTSMPLIQAMDNDTLSLLALLLLTNFGYVQVDEEKKKEVLAEIKGVIQ